MIINDMQELSSILDGIIAENKKVLPQLELKNLQYKIWSFAKVFFPDIKKNGNQQENSLSRALLKIFERYLQIQDNEIKQFLQHLLAKFLDLSNEKLAKEYSDRLILEKILMILQDEYRSKVISTQERDNVLTQVHAIVVGEEKIDLLRNPVKNKPHLASDAVALQRLVSTFTAAERNADNDARLTILERFIKAIHYGELTINGEKPDMLYALGEYLIHGGRILFDLSQLSNEEKGRFIKYIMPTTGEFQDKIVKRMAATHAIGLDSQGKPIDVKLGAMQGVTSDGHYGMDVAIGGYGKLIKNYKKEDAKITHDGTFGHLYINAPVDQPSGIQLGFEEANALQTNQFSGDFHSPTGSGGSYSAFGASRLSDVEGPENSASVRAPISINAQDDANSKYNWNRVVITPEALHRLESDTSSFKIKDDQSNNNHDIHNVVSFLTKPHPQSIIVTDANQRYKNMIQFRKQNKFYKQPKIKNSKEEIEDKEVKTERDESEHDKIHPVEFLKSISKYILSKWTKETCSDEMRQQLDVISKSLLAKQLGKDVDLDNAVQHVIDIGKEGHKRAISLWRYTPFSHSKDQAEYFAMFLQPPEIIAQKIKQKEGFEEKENLRK